MAATAGTAAAAGCEQATWRDYEMYSQEWSTINRRTQFGPHTTGRKTLTSTKTTTKTVSLEGDVGVSVSVAMVEVNAGLGGGYARSVTISRGETTEVNIADRSYEQVATFGIWKKKYYVTQRRLTPSCARVTLGTAFLTVYVERAAVQRA